MKLIYCCIFFCINTLQAQIIPYEKLDFLSAQISKIQSAANEKIYTDGTGFYEVSFNDANFTLFFNTQLATKSVYKKGAIQEVLALTENIDFAKATDIKNMALGGLAGTIRVFFPKDYLSTQLYDNGVLLRTFNESYLEFFYDKTNKNDVEKLWSLLSEMVALTKQSKKQSYETFLNQAIYHNKYDKIKKEAHLQELIKKGNSEAMRLKGEDYFESKDYDNAVLWFEKSYKQNNYAPALNNMAVCKILGKGYTQNYNDFIDMENKAANLGSANALLSIGQRYANKNDYATAITYMERAIAAGFLHEYYRGLAYQHLLYYYAKLNQYNKVADLLTNENIYSSGLSEADLLDETYSLLTGNGSCNEAITYFTQMLDGANTKDVKAKLYECIAKVYDYGCKGSKGNKVKENKKIAQEFYAKSKAALN